MLTLNICCCCKCPLYHDWDFFDKKFSISYMLPEPFSATTFGYSFFTSEVLCNWPWHCKEWSCQFSHLQAVSEFTIATRHRNQFYSECQQFDKYHTVIFLLLLICSKYASMPEHKENYTLEKLAAALYSETTVELSPCNWGCRGKYPLIIAALAIKPMPVLKCKDSNTCT